MQPCIRLQLVEVQLQELEAERGVALGRAARGREEVQRAPEAVLRLEFSTNCLSIHLSSDLI